MSLNEQQLKYFADFIYKEIGIVYNSAVYFQLEQRLEKCATKFEFKNTEDLFSHVQKFGLSGDIKNFIINISTNNETSFFRDPKIFQSIEADILPNLVKNFPNSISFRFWCAAASFGQEPYSLAMLVYEFLQKNPGHPRIEILATDIADHALDKCKSAQYTNLEISRGLTQERTKKYFSKIEEDKWELKKEIKHLVDFRKQNLLDPFTSLGTFQLILCRYVLIYQDAEKKKNIIKKIEKILYPNGYLILGASESAFGLTTELTQKSLSDGAIVYTKN